MRMADMDAGRGRHELDSDQHDRAPDQCCQPSPPAHETDWTFKLWPNIERPARHLPRSALRPPDDVHQLFDLPALLGLVARRDRMLDAVPHVIAQDFLFQPP